MLWLNETVSLADRVHYYRVKEVHPMARSSRYRWIVGMAFVAILSASAMAGNVQVFSTEADWLARSTNLTTVTFSGLAPAGGYTFFNTAAGLTTGGVNFVGYSQNPVMGPYWLAVVDPGLDPSAYGYGTGAVLRGLSGPNEPTPGYITATLNGNYTSISADLNTVLGAGANVIVTLSTGEVIVVATTNVSNTLSFFGITSDVGISSISFQSSTDQYLVMDNFTYGDDPPTVPEPGSLMLFGSGLFVVAGILRRKLHRS
jgi:hypothetical protein